MSHRFLIPHTGPCGLRTGIPPRLSSFPNNVTLNREATPRRVTTCTAVPSTKRDDAVERAPACTPSAALRANNTNVDTSGQRIKKFRMLLNSLVIFSFIFTCPGSASVSAAPAPSRNGAGPREAAASPSTTSSSSSNNGAAHDTLPPPPSPAEYTNGRFAETVGRPDQRVAQIALDPVVTPLLDLNAATFQGDNPNRVSLADLILNDGALHALLQFLTEVAAGSLQHGGGGGSLLGADSSRGSCRASFCKQVFIQ